MIVTTTENVAGHSTVECFGQAFAAHVERNLDTVPAAKAA